MLPCVETKRSGYMRRPGKPDLRYPSFFSHEFPCGALIESEYIVRRAYSGDGGGAYWEVRTVTGCRHATHQAMRRPSSAGQRREVIRR